MLRSPPPYKESAHLSQLALRVRECSKKQQDIFEKVRTKVIWKILGGSQTTAGWQPSGCRGCQMAAKRNPLVLLVFSGAGSQMAAAGCQTTATWQPNGCRGCQMAATIDCQLAATYNLVLHKKGIKNMSRFTIRFDDVLSEAISERAKKRDINVAEYIRSLVELGMKIEDAKSSQEKEKSILSKIENIDEHTFYCVAEMLILIKNIFINGSKDPQNADAILKQIRERAHTLAAEQLKQFSAETTEAA